MLRRKKTETPKGPHYFVRHGQYDHETGKLTAEGEAEAARARDYLSSRGLGREALILSSAYLRATKTAEVISHELYSKPFNSIRMALGGENPLGIRDLDQFLDKALTESGQKLSPDQPLIVVSHGPLIAKIKGGARLPGYGEVVQYTPGSWENKSFNPAIERSLEQMIASEIADQAYPTIT